MPLCLTYLVTEVASSFYTKLNVGTEANVMSIDLTLARHRRRRPPGGVAASTATGGLGVIGHWRLRFHRPTTSSSANERA